MKDWLMVEGVTPNAGYFEIGQDEWSRTRENVMTRFRPIVECAFGGLDAVRAQSRLRQLVERLWDAKDIDALAPVIKAMELDPREAPAALHSWKGVIYYDHRMASLEASVREFAEWLGRDAEQLDLVPTANRRIVLEVRDATRALLRERWLKARARLAGRKSVVSGKSGSGRGK